MPINLEGKPNWGEIRENFYSYPSKYEKKSVTLLEKLVQEFRMVCQQIIQRDNFSKKAAKEGQQLQYSIPSDAFDIAISPQQAETFYHNTNLLKFIRKNILFNNQKVFLLHQDEYVQEAALLESDDPAYFSPSVYDPKLQDRCAPLTQRAPHIPLRERLQQAAADPG